MKQRNGIAVFSITLLAVAVIFSFSFPSRIQTKVDVEKLIDSWVSGWNSYDLAIVDKLFLSDDRVTYFSSEKDELIKGFDAVRKHHEGFGFVEGGKDQSNKLWVEDITIHIFETAASVTGIWYFGIGTPPSIKRNF